MNETVTLLQTYGGWACTFFLGMSIYKFYGDFKHTVGQKDEELKALNIQIQAVNQQHHTEIVAVVRECTGVLTTVSDSLNRLDLEQNRRDSDAR